MTIVQKDENQGPVPSAWRPVLSAIVNAFVEGDYALSRGIRGVSPLSPTTAEQIKRYITDYGEVLIPLPDETWATSVCVWAGAYWDVMVDLWTHGEGRSDMVLRANVTQSHDGFAYEVYMVYVP